MTLGPKLFVDIQINHYSYLDESYTSSWEDQGKKKKCNFRFVVYSKLFLARIPHNRHCSLVIFANKQALQVLESTLQNRRITKREQRERTNIIWISLGFIFLLISLSCFFVFFFFSTLCFLFFSSNIPYFFPSLYNVLISYWEISFFQTEYNVTFFF